MRRRWTGCSNCKKEHTLLIQAVALQQIAALSVSVLDEGTKTYINGFELISEDLGIPNIILGYCLPERQITIDLHGQDLRGLTVMTSNGGIQAIRPIFNTSFIAIAIGQPDQNNSRKSTQLTLETEVKAILGKFDVNSFFYMLY